MSDEPIGAHELLTPLHAIDGAVEMLLDGSTQKLSSDAHELVALIASASRELTTKIDLLMAIAASGIQAAGFRSSYALVEVANALGWSDRLPENGELRVEIELSDLVQARRTLVETCGLERAADEGEWRIDQGHVVTPLGRIVHDLAAGEGTLALRLARLRAERAGVELWLDHEQNVRLAIPLSKSPKIAG